MLPAMMDEDDDFRLGVKVRLFNHNLDTAIREKQKKLGGVTRVAIAKELGMHFTELAQYTSFRRYPSEEKLLKMALFFEKQPEHLFPAHLADVQLKKQPEALALTAEEWGDLGYLRATPQLEADFEREDLKTLVAHALSTLTDREAKVLSLRYGLEDGHEHSYEETAQKIAPAAESLHPNHPGYRNRNPRLGPPTHVTRERIRQIEAKALRKLRHPTRSRALAQYVPGAELMSYPERMDWIKKKYLSELDSPVNYSHFGAYDMKAHLIFLLGNFRKALLDWPETWNAVEIINEVETYMALVAKRNPHHKPHECWHDTWDWLTWLGKERPKT